MSDNPNPPPPPNTPSGEPMDVETLLDFAEIDPADIESAAEWWDEHASPLWVGALDSEPVEGDGNG